MFFGLLTGCATTEYRALPPEPGAPAVPAAAESVKPKGIYHKVTKGQTLWRIAKYYGVNIDEVIQSNKIPSAASLEVDQLIFIPGAEDVKEIPVRTVDENTLEFAWPIKGRLVSYFNDKRGESINRGIDIEVNEGDTVKATREGTVVLADYMAGYGQTIMIDHGDGFVSVYAQNRQLLSKVGDRVFKGDPIAQAGKSGRRNIIHFELRKAEQAVNPLYYLPS